MRPRTGALVAAAAAVLLTGCGAGGAAGAASSCVGPQLTLVPDRAVVGQEVTVSVEWLHEGCNDHTGADEERPLTDVPVSFVQGATEVRLGTVSGTGDRYAGSLTVAVPGDAGPGPAEVRLGAGGRADLTVLP